MKRARRRAEVLGRAADAEGFIRALGLAPAKAPQSPRDGHPWDLPFVGALGAPGGLALHPRITYLVGENASGKSTLLEAIAVAAGMSPEGGASHFAYDTEKAPDLPDRYGFAVSPAHRALGNAVTLVRGARRPRRDFFLRAESLTSAGGYLQQVGGLGRALTEQSHGEAFLELLLERFGPDGLYLLDEPEAALSVQNQLTALQRIDDLARAGAQFVIATHSPLVLAHPDATIYELSADRPPEAIEWESAEPVRLSRAFLEDRERFLSALLERRAS